MQIPLQIHFHDIDFSPSIDSAVRKRAQKLEQFDDQIISCRVTIETPHKHHHKGKLYRVIVDVRTPGANITTSRGTGDHHSHEDVYVAIRDAFKATRRQLQDRVRIKRGQVKSHELPAQGIVKQLYPELDYGLISEAAGREIYFHRNSVINTDFEDLESGVRVRFAEEAGDKGPQATSVYRISK